MSSQQSFNTAATRQQNAVVIDNLIDLTSYEIGDTTASYASVRGVAGASGAGNPAASQMTSQATRNGGGLYLQQQQQQQQRSGVGAEKIEAARINLVDSADMMDLDILSDAGILSEAAVRGGQPPMKRLSISSNNNNNSKGNGGGGLRLDDSSFPESLALSIRENQEGRRQDDGATSAASVSATATPKATASHVGQNFFPSPTSGIIRLDSILDHEDDKRREREAAATPEPIPVSPSLETEYYPTRNSQSNAQNNHRSNGYSGASSNADARDDDEAKKDTDGIMNDSAVRHMQTPEPRPATSSLDTKQYRRSPLAKPAKRDFVAEARDRIAHYRERQRTPSPKRSPKDFVDKATSIREKQLSSAPIPASPSLETEMYTASGPSVATSPRNKLVVNHNDGSDEAGSSDSVASDNNKPHWSRVSVTKLSDRPTQQQQDAGSGDDLDVIDVEALANESSQMLGKIVKSPSAASTSTAGSFDGIGHHQSTSMYRRAILARKRKNVAAQARSTSSSMAGSSVGSFKPILSNRSEDASYASENSYRRTLRDKYRSIVISPIRSSMDMEDSVSFRFDDEEMKTSLEPTVSADQGALEAKGLPLTPGFERKGGQLQTEERQEAESRPRVIDDRREKDSSPGKSIDENALEITSKASAGSIQSAASANQRTRSPLIYQRERKTDGQSTYSAEVQFDVPDIPQVNSAPHQTTTIGAEQGFGDGDDIPEIPQVLSEPRKRIRLPPSVKDHRRKVVKKVAKNVSTNKASRDEFTESTKSAEMDTAATGPRDAIHYEQDGASIVNSEKAFLDMRKLKHLRLEMKEFNNVVNTDVGDIQDDETMHQSVMELVNNDDDDQENEGAQIKVGYSQDLAISDSSSSDTSEEGQVNDKPSVATKQGEMKKKKTVEFAELPSPINRVPGRKVDAVRINASEDESSGEENSKYSSDEQGKFSSDEHGNTSEGAESDSKVSIINSELSYSADELDPELDPHVLYDSEAMHFVVQMLDRSCAWLEDDGWNCNYQGPSLLREIKKKSMYEQAVFEKTAAADRRKNGRAKNSQKSRIVGKAPATLFRKTSKQMISKSPVVQKLGNESRVQDTLSSDTDPNDTDDPHTNKVSIFARPRRKRPPSPRKKKKDSPKNDMSSPASPTRRKRSKSPRKKSTNKPLDLVPSSPQPQSFEPAVSPFQPQSFEPPVSPFQKKLQERLDKVRGKNELDLSELSEEVQPSLQDRQEQISHADDKNIQKLSQPSDTPEVKSSDSQASFKKPESQENNESEMKGTSTPRSSSAASTTKPSSPASKTEPSSPASKTRPISPASKTKPSPASKTRPSSPASKTKPPSPASKAGDVEGEPEAEETNPDVDSHKSSPRLTSPAKEAPRETKPTDSKKPPSPPTATPSSRSTKKHSESRSTGSPDSSRSRSPPTENSSSPKFRVEPPKKSGGKAKKKADAPESKAKLTYRKKGLSVDTATSPSEALKPSRDPSPTNATNPSGALKPARDPTPTTQEKDVVTTVSEEEINDAHSASTGDSASSRRAFGGPESHSNSRTSNRRSRQQQQLPPKESTAGGSVHFVNRLETIHEVNDSPRTATSKLGEEEMDAAGGDGEGVGGSDPFAGLTEEERVAALELAEKLRRRAATLKRRRRAREQRFRDFVVSSEGEEESYATGMSYTTGRTSYGGNSYNSAEYSYGGSVNSFGHSSANGRTSSSNNRKTVESSVQ